MDTNTDRLSLAMERTGQWVFTQGIPADIIVTVGESSFPLHKFMLVAKSNYIRRLILDSKDPDLARLDISNIPGGSEIFEKAAKFCYGVNFEITVHNVAALRCAAEYLQMTDKYCDNNLASRTDDFLNQVALTNLPGAVIVFKTCKDLLPMAIDVNIVQRCVDVISIKACNEASFPSRTPSNWWTEDLALLDINSFQKVLTAMRARGAKILTISSAIITYSRDLVRDPTVCGTSSLDSVQQLELLESIITLLPPEKAAFPISFLCSLLRCAIFLKASNRAKNELEKRISAILEHATVDHLLVLSFTYDGESLFDLESVRRVVSGFVEKERSVDVFNGGNFKEVCSAAVQRVAKTVDSYLAEIATYAELSISKFNGIANLVPKGSRRLDDDLYRAIDIYLKAHPNLDEIEREKVCSAMDSLKLSYEARVHASQNKRLPVNVVLHALYYDQLNLRGGGVSDNAIVVPNAIATRGQVKGDASLAKENEVLKSELMKMKMYISDLQRNPVAGTSSRAPSGPPKKTTFFSSMSKTLGKFNPFKNGSKDTSNLEEGVDLTKPRKRRFSIS